MSDVLALSPRASVLPVVHGSGDFALEARRRLHRSGYDCLAVALPPSFSGPVEAGVAVLPRVSAAIQREISLAGGYSWVPVDPCQPVIAAIREAMDLDIARAYVDLEVDVLEADGGVVLPDPYALKAVPLERWAAAVVAALPAPPAGGQRLERIRRMAWELHRLELDYGRLLLVCSVADWPWIRQAYAQRAPYAPHSRQVTMPELRGVPETGLYYVLGELPYVTYQYEHRRAELMADQSLSVDGIKALLLRARDRWRAARREEPDGGDEPGPTAQTLSLLLRYARNLTLLDRRLTPDLYNLALAAKQVVGDDYALAVAAAAGEYPPQRMPSQLAEVLLGPDHLIDPASGVRRAKNRLPGPPRIWRRLPLRPRPATTRRRQWSLQWDPFGQCSHPPEDDRIESFHQHVRQQARLAMGTSEGRTEKFAASLKDGLDIRETLRNWHTGDIYVRELPPARGSVEVVVFLFDTPADPGRYVWRSTWYAEHPQESTLCFFATHFLENMVGPGIGQALYGGCFFLYPPRPIADVWQDRRFDFCATLEERLVAGALHHSRQRRVALVSPTRPSAALRRLARACGRQIVHLPLRRFSPATVDRLRRFHVLNGRQVRSYAGRFIRDLR